jgi:hypothetical protein
MPNNNTRIDVLLWCFSSVLQMSGHAPSRASLEFEKVKARTGVPGYAKPKKKMSLAEEDESTMEYRAGHEDMPFVNKAPRRKGQDPASLDPFANVTKRKPRKSK